MSNKPYTHESKSLAALFTRTQQHSHAASAHWAGRVDETVRRLGPKAKIRKIPPNKQTKEGATSLRAPAHAKPQSSNQTRLGMSVTMATANGESGLNIQSPLTKYTSAARLVERASEREMQQGVTDRQAGGVSPAVLLSHCDSCTC